MLGPLALVAVRQQQHQAREQAPLVLARAEELVDDDLRVVGEVAELRLPQHEGLGVVATEAVLEGHHGRLRERRVVNLAERAALCQAGERHVLSLGLGVDEHRVALVEGAALAVLPSQTDGQALPQQAPEGERLGAAVIEFPFPRRHLRALLEQPAHLDVDVEAVRPRGQDRPDLLQRPERHARVDLVGGIVTAALVSGPVGGQLGQRHAAGELLGFLLCLAELRADPGRQITGVDPPPARRTPARAADGRGSPCTSAAA